MFYSIIGMISKSFDIRLQFIFCTDLVSDLGFPKNVIKSPENKDSLTSVSTFSAFNFFVLLNHCTISPPETTILLKTKGKSLLPASCWLHRVLDQTLQPQAQAFQRFIFYTQRLYPGQHTSVSTKWNYRSQKARLVH